jgi:large subunit ribosomal protein L18
MGYKRFDKPVRRFKPKSKPKPRHRRFVRRKLYGTTECPRLVVFRSHKHIYGQLIDDSIKKTLITVSSRSKDLRPELESLPDKMSVARAVGRALAAKAKTMNIQRVVFDRKSYVYHGRVKALAEGVREGNLLFHWQK